MGRDGGLVFIDGRNALGVSFYDDVLMLKYLLKKRRKKCVKAKELTWRHR